MQVRGHVITCMVTWCRVLQNEWRTLRRAKIAVLVVFIAACVYNIPRFFEREVVLEPLCAGGEPIPHVHLTLPPVPDVPAGGRPHVRWTSLRNDRVYFLVYKTVFYFIFRSVGPLVALIALNSRLAVELRNVDRRRSELRGNTSAVARLKAADAKQHENLTAMLVGVVTVFIICQLPGLGVRVAQTVLYFAKASSTAIQLDLITLRYANYACNAMLIFNSAVNIVVYCLVGKRFRRILLDEMLSCSCCRCCSSSGNASRATSRVTMLCDSHM